MARAVQGGYIRLAGPSFSTANVPIFEIKVNQDLIIFINFMLGLLRNLFVYFLKMF